MKKIAVLFTTFLRPELAQITVNSIIENTCEKPGLNTIILIGDQDESLKEIHYKRLVHYKLPFDCGLSASRNFLVQKAKEMNCEYCLLTADSIKFTEMYNFNPVIDFLEKEEKRALMGFQLNSRLPWEGDLELIEGKHFLLDTPKRPKIIFKGMTIQPVDICRNFFLAKTDALLQVQWDKELRLAEHEDWFYRFKQAGYESFYTDYIKADYIGTKDGEYGKYRGRIGEFKRILLKKYNLKEWIKYTPEMKKLFEEFKANKK